MLHHPADAAVLKCIREMHWDGMKKKFAKLGVAITKPHTDWQAIMGVKESQELHHALRRPRRQAEGEEPGKLQNYRRPIENGYFRMDILCAGSSSCASRWTGLDTIVSNGRKRPCFAFYWTLP